ncbi:hypothetical protein AB9L17_08510 [Bacillus sp. RS11]
MQFFHCYFYILKVVLPAEKAVLAAEQRILPVEKVVLAAEKEILPAQTTILAAETKFYW